MCLHDKRKKLNINANTPLCDWDRVPMGKGKSASSFTFSGFCWFMSQNYYHFSVNWNIYSCKRNPLAHWMRPAAPSFSPKLFHLPNISP